MRELKLYSSLLFAYPIVAALVAAILLFITAPYGRHNVGRAWGPQLPSWLGWLLMEAPASLLPIVLFAVGERRGLVTLIFLLVWQLHYFNRAFVFPFRRRGGVATMPLVIASSGFFFNLINGYLNWRFLTHFAPAYPPSWLTDPRFVCGLLLFGLGFAINQHADWVLIHLRQPGETGYKIPHGGLYRFISCPNFFGELVEWCGWALCTFSVAGLGFAIWTAANLLPRALAHHRDYRRRFTDYPPDRRALIPFLL